MKQRDYDSTVARVAGNILAGLVMHPEFGPNEQAADRAVELARHIVSEVKRTEPDREGR